MTNPPSPNGPNDRDTHGRFVPGNPGGPGNPYASRASELYRAAMDAITPEHVRALIRKAIKMGLEGDVQAMKFAMDRVIGRPKEASPDAAAIAIALPVMKTAENCNEAIGLVIDAMCGGELDQAAAQVLISAVQTRMKSLELVDFERRLAEMEKAQAERNGGKRGRR